VLSAFDDGTGNGYATARAILSRFVFPFDFKFALSFATVALALVVLLEQAPSELNLLFGESAVPYKFMSQLSEDPADFISRRTKKPVTQFRRGFLNKPDRCAECAFTFTLISHTLSKALDVVGAAGITAESLIGALFTDRDDLSTWCMAEHHDVTAARAAVVTVVFVAIWIEMNLCAALPEQLTTTDILGVFPVERL
jgi:hypothetical protein